VVPSRTPFVRRRRHGYAATPRTREAPTPESRSLRSGCGNAIHRIATERSSRSSSHAPHFPRRRAPVPVGPCAVGPTGCGPLRRNPPFAPHYARSVLRSLRFPLAPLTTSLRCYDAGAFSTTPLTPSLPLAPIVSVGLTTRYRLLRRSRCSAGSALPLRYVAPARRKGGRPTGSYEAPPFRSSYLRPTSVEALPTVGGWSEGHLARPCSTDSHSARDAPESLLRLLRARSSPHWFARLLARSAPSSSILRTSLSSVAEFLGVSSLVRQHAGWEPAQDTPRIGDLRSRRCVPQPREAATPPTHSFPAVSLRRGLTLDARPWTRSRSTRSQVPLPAVAPGLARYAPRGSAFTARASSLKSPVAPLRVRADDPPGRANACSLHERPFVKRRLTASSWATDDAVARRRRWCAHGESVPVRSRLHRRLASLPPDDSGSPPPRSGSPPRRVGRKVARSSRSLRFAPLPRSPLAGVRPWGVGRTPPR